VNRTGYHLLVTDPEARVCDFVRDLNSLIARSLNAEIGHWEHFWDAARTSIVRLVEADDIAEKMVYTLANPVSSGLVDSGRKWPGLRRGPRELLRPARRAQRMGRLFGKRSSSPPAVDFELSKAPGFEDLTTEEYVELIEERVEERERGLREEAREAGREFLGKKAILTQEPHDRPRSREPRRKLDPKVACRNPAKRILALRELKGFVKSYREALDEFRSGLREAFFPLGTWSMRVRLAVNCHGGSG
jgi:hypothetical protein